MLLIALGLFGLYSVEFGVVGILPEISTRYGVSVAKAGWLVSLFAFVIAFLGPPLVALLSKVDRRWLLCGSLFTFAICSAASAVAPSYWVLMALRIPSALAHPVFFAAAFAASLSLYPPERATHATTMAFVGTSMGMVLGVPLTTWIAARFSFEASFIWCAAINAGAGIGLMLLLPPSPTTKAATPPASWHILARPAVWLAVAMTVCVFASGFSVYSYAAEYLARRANIGGETVGLLLIVFGLGGVLGNIATGRLLAHRQTMTVLMYPVALGIAYLILYLFGGAAIVPLAIVCFIWGAAHTSGLVVSQVWLTSAAPEAREFATSIYLSAANIGVMIGAGLGGLAMSLAGLEGPLLCGWLFAALALATIVARLSVDARPLPFPRT